MQTVLLVIHLMIVAALVVVVLLQRSDGGALGIGGGGGFMTGRGQANALTRATAILGTAFFVTSILLTVIATVQTKPRSIIDGAAPASSSAPVAPSAPGGTPAGGNLLDQLNKMQGGSQPPAPAAPAPAAPPAAPAAPAPVQQ
jgi:preprotein translocase subunit SecG